MRNFLLNDSIRLDLRGASDHQCTEKYKLTIYLAVGDKTIGFSSISSTPADIFTLLS